MATTRKESSAQKIFENILFLAEVFGDRPDHDIPRLPVLEMARCFELSHRPAARPKRRRDWSLWG